MHEDGFVIGDVDGFRAQGDAALAQLGGTPLSAGISSGRLNRQHGGEQLSADTSNGWFVRLQGFLMLGFMVACAIAGAYFCWKGFGGVGGVVMGLIGGYAIGAYILSMVRKVLEMLFGLLLIGCAIGLVASFFR